MGRLVYTAQCSLDGFTEDASGAFDFTMPSSQVHAFVNDRERTVGTYLLGRRMFDTMRIWDTDAVLGGADDEAEREILSDFAEIYRGIDKVVYSRTLASVDAPRTRLVRAFDPAEVRALVEAASAEVSVGGPELAAHALRAGLVDQINLLMSPIIVGSGKPALPSDVRLDLQLIETHSFDNGTIAAHYLVRR